MYFLFAIDLCQFHVLTRVLDRISFFLQFGSIDWVSLGLLETANGDGLERVSELLLRHFLVHVDVEVAGGALLVAIALVQLFTFLQLERVKV